MSRKHTIPALVAAALVATAPGALFAQDHDTRWQAWLGCWKPDAAQAAVVRDTTAGAPERTLVCIVPGNTPTSVEVVRFDGDRIASRGTIEATGARVVKSVDNCTGWEEARWSGDSRRVMIRSEYNCVNNVTRRETGLLAMNPAGHWLQVQNMSVNGNGALYLGLMREAGISLDSMSRNPMLAPLVQNTRTRAFSNMTARLGAGSPVSVDAVVEMVKFIDVAVVEAWLGDRRQSFNVTGGDLVRLSNAGVPDDVLDVIVALDHPTKFAMVQNVDRTAVTQETREQPMGRVGMATVADYGTFGGYWGSFGMYGLYGGMNPWGPWGPYGYSGWRYGYGYPYGAGIYPTNGFWGNGYPYGGRPIIVIPRGQVQQNARAVNGRGYTRGNTPPQTQTGSYVPSARQSPPTTTTTRSGTAGSSGSSGSSSGASTGRTAKARGGN